MTGPNGTEVEGCRIIFVFNDFPDRRPFFDRYPPYYNNYGNRLPFYNNYDRRPYHRDQNGQRDGKCLKNLIVYVVLGLNILSYFGLNNRNLTSYLD